YATGPLREYFARPLAFVENLGALRLAAGAGAAVVFALSIAACRRAPRMADFVRAWVPWAFVATLLLTAVYAYAFRRPVQGPLADFDAYALRTFVAFYLTLPAFLAALLGLVLTKRAFWRDPAFFLTFGVVCLFTFYKTRIVPEHFWAARRFVAEILPGGLLLLPPAAVGAPRGRRPAGRRLRGALGLPV